MMRKFFVRLSLVVLVVVSGWSSGAGAVPVITNGLVASYSFEGNLNDDSPAAAHGVPNGGVGFGQGISGQAASFDGVNDYIVLPSHSSRSFYSGDFTVSYWINTSQWGNTFDARCCGEWGYSLGGGAGGPGFGVFAQGGPHAITSSTINLLDSNWHMVTGIRQGTTARLYIDGAIEATNAIPLIDVGGSNPVYLGRRYLSPENPDPWLQGNLDELVIYNRALSPTEVSTLYSAVPEPSTALLLGLGLLGLGIKTRRQPRGASHSGDGRASS